ncbi:hypothetical protein EJ04DRAFT_159093 [Polyplosphaeria fusca]|uniref:Uncharacterized protein n=1 Tax=Polyplosphaeria fusca TaxID=682080 RepID=A0A9P4R461_9PLEO|nr:hypothetical protein EJ04DRAFT_159093 [Polyplosphaeria fusca]
MVQASNQAFYNAYRAALQKVQQRNLDARKDYNERLEMTEKWDSKDSKLKLIMINTVPSAILEIAQSHTYSKGMYDTVCAQFRDQGLTEACLIWGDFFRLRYSDCSSTTAFCEKFHLTLAITMATA